MSPEIIGILVFIVAVIVGPFAAIRAVSHFKSRRNSAPPPTKPKSGYDDEDKSGW